MRGLSPFIFCPLLFFSFHPMKLCIPLNTHSAYFVPLLALVRWHVAALAVNGNALASVTVQAQHASRQPPATVATWLRQQSPSPMVIASLRALDGRFPGLLLQCGGQYSPNRRCCYCLSVNPQCCVHPFTHHGLPDSPLALTSHWLRDARMADLHAMAMGCLGAARPVGGLGTSEGDHGVSDAAPLFYMSKEGNAGVFAAVSDNDLGDDAAIDGSEDESDDVQ